MIRAVENYLTTSVIHVASLATIAYVADASRDLAHNTCRIRVGWT
jgi:hypothetical protein